MLSDHCTIHGTVPTSLAASGLNTANDSRPWRVHESDFEKFAETVQALLPASAITNTPISNDLEQEAETVINTLQHAMHITGSKTKPQKGRAAPWWIEKCAEAYAAAKDSITDGCTNKS